MGVCKVRHRFMYSQTVCFALLCVCVCECLKLCVLHLCICVWSVWNVMHVDMCGPGAHPISTPKVIHKDFPKQKLDMVVGRGRFSTQGQKWFLEVDDVNELGTCMSLCVNVCVRMYHF